MPDEAEERWIAQLGGDRPSFLMPPAVMENQDWDGYENLVDEFIQKQKLKQDDLFHVQEPDGVKLYKYLGPNSGGRKDWMQVNEPVLTS